MRVVLTLVVWLCLAVAAAAQGCGPTNPNCIVPTAPAGTNNNQAASTAFVSGQSLTISGPLAINSISGTANQGLAINNSNPTGTGVTSNIPNYALLGSYGLNSISVATDSIALSNTAGVVSALSITHQFGGSNTTGGRSALGVTASLTAADNASNPSPSWVAGQFYTTSAINDGGTGTGAGTSRGQLAGVNPFVVAFSGATNYNQVVSGEFNVSARAGSSMYYKAGLSITEDAADAVQGSTFDAAINITNATGAVGWKNGILFSNGNGQQPIISTGCLICTSVPAFPTIGTGIDISGYTISGFAFRSPGGYAIDGFGNVTVSAHFVGGGSVAPTFASCGAGASIVGTDWAGKINTGTGAGTCVVTFHNTYANLAICFLVQLGSSTLPALAGQTNGSFSFVANSSVTYNYACFAQPGG